MAHPYGSPPHAVVGVAASHPDMPEIVQDDREEAAVGSAGFQHHREDGRKLVGLAAQGVAPDDMDRGLELFREELDAERENLALVLEIEIQDGTGDATAFGDLLEGGILVALVDEDIKGFFQYLPLPFFVLDRD